MEGTFDFETQRFQDIHTYKLRSIHPFLHFVALLIAGDTSKIAVHDGRSPVSGRVPATCWGGSGSHFKEQVAQ